MLEEEVSTEGPIHLYCSLSLSLLAKFNKQSPLSNPFNETELCFIHYETI